jgi:predicted ABC-type ATPase
MGRALMQPPRVVVLGGVNGAGKTTSAFELLVNVLNIPVFTNADAIARGLNQLNPELEAFRAGRVMLEWMKDLADQRRDFAFETTLAARTYVPWLKEMKSNGYQVLLYYTWLASAEVAIDRVALRVQSGGHHIPDEDVKRRYARSVRNFLELYRPLADHWELFDNTLGYRKLIAMGNTEETLYETPEDWRRIERSAE